MKNPKTTQTSRIHRLCLIASFTTIPCYLQNEKNVTRVAKLFFSLKECRTNTAMNPYRDWVL